MTPLTFSLRPICRILLALWLVLLVSMSALVAGATRTSVSGNLLAFLLSGPQQTMPVMPISSPLPAPAPSPAPQIIPEPEPVQVPVSEWAPLPRGKKQGSGTLKTPEITTLPDGSVQVVFPYEAANGKPGDPGSVTSNKVSPHATSVDLHGPWRHTTYINKTMGKESVLSRLQIAEHTGYIRISGTAKGAAPQEITEYTTDRIRIVFSAPQNRQPAQKATPSSKETP